MISPYTLGWFELIAGYVVLAALLLSINLWARVRWGIKAAAIVVTTGFFFITFVSINQLLGWPTDQQMPERFEMLYAVIQEPDPATRDPGAIYIWAMVPPDGAPADRTRVDRQRTIAVEPGQMPRAYRLPYSRPLHKDIFVARQKVIDGVRQIGVAAQKPRDAGEQATQSKFRFFDRPKPILPPKEPPPAAR